MRNDRVRSCIGYIFVCLYAHTIIEKPHSILSTTTTTRPSQFGVGDGVQLFSQHCPDRTNTPPVYGASVCVFTAIKATFVTVPSQFAATTTRRQLANARSRSPKTLDRVHYASSYCRAAAIRQRRRRRPRLGQRQQSGQSGGVRLLFQII